MDILHEGLLQLGFNGDILKQLDAMLNAYIDELLLFNKRRRMVNTDNRDEIIIRHLLDCLAAYPVMSGYLQNADAPVIVDVGSGAGLPGIPLACAFTAALAHSYADKEHILHAPQVHFVLIERMASRAAFLNDEAAMLCLHNVEVWQYDAGSAPKKHFADIVTSRAYSPIDNKSIDIYRALAKNGGLIALYKTPKEAEKAKDAVLMQGRSGYCVTPLSVPFMQDRKRCIVSWKTDNDGNGDDK